MKASPGRVERHGKLDLTPTNYNFDLLTTDVTFQLTYPGLPP